ncbi:MAG: SDR family oxidoreductase [Verrucomicrobiota bacterium]
MSEPYVLVTGASSGLGVGFARAYAKKGRSLVLTARREDRLKALAGDLLSDRVKVETVSMDLAEVGAAARLRKVCREKGWWIDGVVNNAGLGFQIDLRDLSNDQVLRMMQVNVVAFTEMMQLFLPEMTARKRGFILNVASTAGFSPVPHFSVYAATKAYVISLSEAVHEEMKTRGVKVCCLCPGPVDTEFQQAAGVDPRFFAATQAVEPVVEKGLALVEKGAALGWSSLYQRVSSLAMELAPRGLRRWVIGQVMKACLRKEAERKAVLKNKL